MYYFIQIACVAAEMWNFHFLLSSLFQKKSRPWWMELSAYLVTGGILAALSLADFHGIQLIRLGYNLLVGYALGQLLFQTTPLRSLFAAQLMCALFALSDMLTFLLLVSCGIDQNTLLSNGPVGLVYVIAAHIVLFGLLLGVYVITRKNAGRLELRILIPTIPCWLVSTLLCVLLAWQILNEANAISPLYLVVLLGLLYTNIIVIYYTNRLSARELEKRERELAEHHYAMQQEYYNQFRIQQEETRALWHDIRKYIRAVEAEGSAAALEQVEQMLNDVTCVVDVGNRVVSVILNEYAQAAREASVRLDLDIRVPRELFVTTVDLYILIGNTLDNAIEACCSLPPDQRSIQLKLKEHNNILFYEIENPYAPSYRDRSRGKMHGYGLPNVRRCVEKYNGSLDISDQNGQFRLSAHLNGI